MEEYANEIDVRNKLAAMARAGALVTYYLQQPSFSKDQVNITRIALNTQAEQMTTFLGNVNDRAVSHQGFHLPAAIKNYGNQAADRDMMCRTCLHVYSLHLHVYYKLSYACQ